MTDSTAFSATATATATIRVWDPLVRLLHWTIVACVAFTAWSGLVLGARWINPHVWVGTALGVAVLIRLIWGFSGSSTARFADFIVGPTELRAHLRALVAGRAERHLGHNPLGGWMILALLAVVAFLVLTGTLLLGGVFKAGPAKALISYDAARALRDPHQLAAYGLLGLVGLHVAGAVFESLRTRENLVRAMVTGRKMRGAARLHGGAVARPLLALAMIAVLGGGLVWLAASGMARTVPQAPVVLAGSEYADNCTDCHMAYHPSLLPAASWQTLMTTLDDHFGEDASIDPDLAASISAWLMANAAEATDSKPAHVLAAVNPDSPTEITTTKFWQRAHRDLPDSLFSAAPVSSKANCAACHTDAATGWFYPAAIKVPSPIATALPAQP